MYISSRHHCVFGMDTSTSQRVVALRELRMQLAECAPPSIRVALAAATKNSCVFTGILQAFKLAASDRH